jgi:hypothetical protein
MPRSKPLLAILWAFVQLGLCQHGTGIEPTSKEEPANDYPQLISHLASPNNKPITKIDARSTVKFPMGYDVEAQKRIAAARQVLHDNIENALPYLVGALDDKRYCMTIDWAEGDGYYNCSVGQICRDVIASQLEVYRDPISFSGPGHWHHYDYSISKEWWEQRKSGRLSDLQIEAIDWAIKRRKTEPKTFMIEGRDRNNEVAELEKLRDSISKSGEPAKPNRMLRMVTRDR